jgi:hypothetical protein
MRVLRLIPFSAAPFLLILLSACPPRNPLAPPATWVTISRIDARAGRPAYTVLLDTITAAARGTASFDAWTIFQYDSLLTTEDSVRLTAQALRQRMDCSARTLQPLEALRFDTTRQKVTWRGSDRVATQAQHANFTPPPGTAAFAVLVSSCMILQHRGPTASTK